MSWSLPNSEIAKMMQENVTAFTPVVSNAVRVRRSGGAENEAGEFVGRTEDRTEIKIAVARERTTAAERREGRKYTGSYVSSFLGDTLAIGDVVEWRSIQLEVIDVSSPELGGDVVYRRATLRKTQT